jgi:hypothetical protein
MSEVYAMNNDKRQLRCYVKKEGDQWVAVCIDLSLAAQADSKMCAKEKLESMIFTYMQDALGRHKKYAHQLLYRKAPFSQQILYYALKFCAFRKQAGLEKGSVFSETFPMQVV